MDDLVQIKALCDCAQDDFIAQGAHDQQLYFNNGDPYPGTHKRFYMEHAGSTGKTSAGEWHNFIKHVSDRDLGLILHYKKGKMSKRMLSLTKKIARHWYDMLGDIPGLFFNVFSQFYNSLIHADIHILRTCCAEPLRRNPEHIARYLRKLARLRQLDTEAYRDSVQKKRSAAKRAAPKPPVSFQEKFEEEKRAHKLSNRAHKRKISKLCKQVKRLRKTSRALKTEVRDLKAENRRLKATIAELENGDHDIELDGEVQEDMMSVLKECRTTPILQEELTKQDASGTLHAFWQEQVERSLKPCDKRKRWNPIVMQFCLHLWEKMGEKNFRILADEKVLHLPHKRTLIRQRRKLSKLDNCDPAIYKQLKELVSDFTLIYIQNRINDDDLIIGYLFIS